MQVSGSPEVLNSNIWHEYCGREITPASILKNKAGEDGDGVDDDADDAGDDDNDGYHIL